MNEAILTRDASECGRGLDEEANEEKMVRWWDGQPDEGRGTRKGIGEEACKGSGAASVIQGLAIVKVSDEAYRDGR